MEVFSASLHLKYLYICYVYRGCIFMNGQRQVIKVQCIAEVAMPRSAIYIVLGVAKDLPCNAIPLCKQYWTDKLLKRDILICMILPSLMKSHPTILKDLPVYHTITCKGNWIWYYSAAKNAKMHDKSLSFTRQHKDWITEKFMFIDKCIFGGTEALACILNSALKKVK